MYMCPLPLKPPPTPHHIPNLFLKLLIHIMFNISLDWSLGNNIVEKYIITRISMDYILLIFNEIPFISIHSIIGAFL